MRARDFSSRRRRRPPAPVDVGLFAVGVLTVVLAGYLTGTAWADFKRARQQVDEVRRDTQAAQARLRSLEARSAPTAALANQALLSTDAAPPRLLAELAALMPPDVRFESIGMRYGDSVALEVQVAARTGGAYEAFLHRLEDSPLFADVLPGDETRDGGVRASVHVRYRGGER
ncbi:MAG TPA: PilN domain-containing protein [Vicinamibacteria bacterium]|nr:PilN domain-containing protein [Vicinamibacteria bacterium]